MDNSQRPAYDPSRYLLGRDPLPPWMSKKNQRVFVYGDKVTVVNGSSATLQIQFDDDAHFIIEAIHAISSKLDNTQDSLTVQITDTTTSRTWSNIPLPMRDVFGYGTSPKYLSDPNLMRPASTLALQFSNNSGADVTVYVALIGRKVYDLAKSEADFLAQRIWYQYGIDVPQLTAGCVDTKASLQVYNESDFLIKKLLSQQLINNIIAATAGTESAEVLMNFQDTTKDQFLFNRKLAARLLLGAYSARVLTSGAPWAPASPFCLKRPWLIRRNGQVTGYFDNLASTAINESIITLEGIRVYSPA